MVGDVSPGGNRISGTLSLIRAAADGNEQALKDLLADGVDVNGANQGGQTAIILAALMGHSEIVSLLLDAGADLRLQDNHGLTALEWAQRRGFWEITELLTRVSTVEHETTPAKATPHQTAFELKAPAEKPAAEDATEHKPDAGRSSELERHRGVEFAPAATDNSKANAKPADLESDLGRLEPPAEGGSISKPAPRNLTEEAQRRRADQIPPTPLPPETLLERIEAERPQSPAEKPRVAEPAPNNLAEQPQRRDGEQMPSTSLPPETVARIDAERPHSPEEKPRIAESARRNLTEEPQRRDGKQTPSTPVSPETVARMDAERPRSPAEKPRVAEPARRSWTGELERREADDAQPAVTDADTLQARLETERIFQQARRRVEEEVRRKVEPETPSAAERELPPVLVARPETSSVKHCPKCNSIFENDIRIFCPYDSARLISPDGPASIAAAQTIGRPTLWALIAITLVGSVGVTYMVTSYLVKEERPAPAAATTGAPAKEENLPLVGGALVGKEINLPNAEYPEKAKSAGASGTVVVVVRVNKKGGVISARALNGDPQLRAAAVKAARQAKFSPEKLAVQGGIASGTITYIFKP